MKNYIGLDKFGDHVFQKLSEDGIIKGFDTYFKAELHDSTEVLSWTSWTHGVELKNGKTYKSGDKAAPEVTDETLENLYTCETVSCEECGALHNSDDRSWTVVEECTAVCLGCRTPEQVLTKLNKPEDLFESKNLEGVSIDAEEYTALIDLFCDSSGLGSPDEPALTKNQAIQRTAVLIDEYENEQLYCGITGIGQFQVYVTVYKKAA